MIAPDAHLVAHVRFDRLSPGGRCPDGSGFGRAPELVGGGRVVPDARFGRCLRLDGTGGLRYLDDPELRLDGSFSVELWVAPRLPVGKCVLVAHLVRAPGTRRTRVPLCELSLSDAGLGTRVLAGPVHATTVRFETPDWRHVAVTYDAGSKQCFTYVDGALAGIHVPGTRDVQGDVTELWIGTDGEGDLGFEGSVGTLRLYDRYRHASEIVEAMHDDRTPRADPGPPRPVVHLPFHDIGADGTSSDATGNGHHAVARGSPITVIDGFFGRSAELDGVRDSFEIAPTDELRLEDAFTIEAWVHPVGVSEVDAIVDVPTELEGRHTPRYALHLERGHLRAYVDGDNVGVATRRLTSRSWHHVAATWDGAVREVRLFIDGEPAPLDRNGRTPSARITDADRHPIRIGYRGTPSYYTGRLAGLRLYDIALDGGQVRADMHRDRHAAGTAFELNYPISFRFFDDDDENTLSIVEEGALGRVCHLAVRNDNLVPIELPPRRDPTPGPDNHHLELRFRPHTLNADSLDAITVLNAGWRIAHRVSDDGMQSLYAVCPDGLVLQPGRRHMLTLAHVHADPSGGARTTRASLHYDSLDYLGDETPLRGSRLERLDVVDRRGRAEPPLRVGFVGSNAITNDGQPNTLTLSLANTSATEPIVLRGPAGPAPVSRFLLDVDEVPNDADPLSWALATHTQVSSIDVVVGRWDITWEKDEFGPSTIWTLHPLDDDVTIAPGEEVRVTLAQLKSNMASGTSELRIRHENVPGYQDGRTTLAIEKCPWIWTSADVTKVRNVLQAELDALGSRLDELEHTHGQDAADVSARFDDLIESILGVAATLEQFKEDTLFSLERRDVERYQEVWTLNYHIESLRTQIVELMDTALRKGSDVTITQVSSGRILDAHQVGGAYDFRAVTREGVTPTRIWKINTR